MLQEPPASMTSSAAMGCDEHQEPPTTGPREWYVVIGAEAVGPMELAELERYWDAVAIDADTRVWRQPMPDWAPLREVEDLAHLPATHPRLNGDANGAARHGGCGSVGHAVAGHEPTIEAGGLRRRGPAQLTEETPVYWSPSAAVLLQDLVSGDALRQQHHAAALLSRDLSGDDVATLPPEAGVVALPGTGLGACDFFAADAARSPVGPAASHGHSAAGCAAASYAAASYAAAGYAAAAAPAPRAARPSDHEMAWSAPESGLSRHAPPSNLLFLMVSLVGVGIVSAVFAVTVMRWMGDTHGVGATAVGAAPSATMALGATAQASRVGGGAALETTAVQATNAGVLQPDVAPQPRPAPASKAVAPRASRSAPAVRSGSNASRSVTPSKVAKPKTVPVEEVVGIVQRQAQTLAPCFQRALNGNEIAPGRYRMLLDWVVKPNGRVRSARLKGPPELTGTSLPGCVSEVMQRWRFPESQRGAPIRNFPLGPVTIR